MSQTPWSKSIISSFDSFTKIGTSRKKNSEAWPTTDTKERGFLSFFAVCKEIHAHVTYTLFHNKNETHTHHLSHWKLRRALHYFQNYIFNFHTGMLCLWQMRHLGLEKTRKDLFEQKIKLQKNKKLYFSPPSQLRKWEITVKNLAQLPDKSHSILAKLKRENMKTKQKATKTHIQQEYCTQLLNCSANRFLYKNNSFNCLEFFKPDGMLIFQSV